MRISDWSSDVRSSDLIVRRPLDRRHDVADAGEMQDDDGLAEQAVAGCQCTDIAFIDNDIGMGPVLLKIGEASAAQVIDDVDAISAPDQGVDGMTADESSAPGNDCDRFRRHLTFSFFIVRML